jgi:Flp pilus assembly protein TadB
VASVRSQRRGFTTCAFTDPDTWRTAKTELSAYVLLARDGSLVKMRQDMAGGRQTRADASQGCMEVVEHHAGETPDAVSRSGNDMRSCFPVYRFVCIVADCLYLVAPARGLFLVLIALVALVVLLLLPFLCCWCCWCCWFCR